MEASRAARAPLRRLSQIVHGRIFPAGELSGARCRSLSGLSALGEQRGGVSPRAAATTETRRASFLPCIPDRPSCSSFALRASLTATSRRRSLTSLAAISEASSSPPHVPTFFVSFSSLKLMSPRSPLQASQNTPVASVHSSSVGGVQRRPVCPFSSLLAAPGSPTAARPGLSLTSETPLASFPRLPLSREGKNTRHRESWAMRTSARSVRTGFFRTDPGFINPEDVLFAEDPGRTWAHADGGGDLAAEVLERSNVGMGTCILNNSAGVLNMRGLCGLHRKLRDLEVNSLKRFVILTSRHRHFFSAGFDLKELLFLAELTQMSSASKQKTIPLVALWQLRNLCDIAYLIHNYTKPLIVLMNGATGMSPIQGSGAALCCLANRSAAYHSSSFTCDPTAYGWIPDSGMSFVLANLRGSLGTFLALTGHTLSGPDLVWSGLCKHWVSPEALPFLELTAEKQLEVSEREAAVLLEEHFLEVPDTYSLDEWEEIIHEHFDASNVAEVCERLKVTASRKTASVVDQMHAAWARAVLDRLAQRSPLAADVTFALIRSVKQLKRDIIQEAGIFRSEWHKIRRTGLSVPYSLHGDCRKQVLEAIEDRLLQEALQLELRAALRLLAWSPDIITGLQFKLAGRLDPEYAYPPQWKKGQWFHKENYLGPLPGFFPPASGFGEAASARGGPQISPSCAYFFPCPEFSVAPRTLFPLSAHPLLRRIHPDFDEDTGNDHDPYAMHKLQMQWNHSLFIQERIQALKQLRSQAQAREHVVRGGASAQED
ncbi:enoyl-CoA hydratase/isomerase family protein [Besnoitia besnoiti]|uniref:Enoyl-CoA hydratase/isomerase family protein n=1 Tax=Besnoitia besnoiti TaxID=94643 RepID=A0A2A9M378_BESBE|nr:enoyl-CoA hydratase/isomerase family protein [Besnoitia besnoiti]PFH32415.1 enoyl-CoA hydratase/isomerase family protein [Besnoitia besnoiti]